jgi:acetyl-CoA synthetase
LTGIKDIIEVAAIAVKPSEGGPDQLVIYAATTNQPDKKEVQVEMQKKLNLHLNPLFRITDVVFVQDLPKTASNKIMRRVLRKNYFNIL